jgi:predicted MPP superfamily phosphohydrolase
MEKDIVLDKARLAWVTDIHLDFISKSARNDFYKKMKEIKCDGFAITGDIANGELVFEILKDMAEVLEKNIYFVFGNHDYYSSSIKVVRKRMKAMLGQIPFLHYLTLSKYHILSPNTAIVGRDCWYDMRNGYGGFSTGIKMNDWRCIDDFFGCHAEDLTAKIMSIADKEANALKKNIQSLIKNNPAIKNIIILTHVPPFAKTSLVDPDYMQFYSSKIAGDVIRDVALKNLDKTFYVYSGHTHRYTKSTIEKNIVAYVGYSEYSNPQIQDHFITIY